MPHMGAGGRLAAHGCVRHIWTHYEFTQDREFLRKMYPVLREATTFMLDFLVESKDGYLVTAPSLPGKQVPHQPRGDRDRTD